MAVASAMPGSVKWFEMKRAPLRLRYDPYDVTWAQFKQEHGKMITEFALDHKLLGFLGEGGGIV